MAKQSARATNVVRPRWKTFHFSLANPAGNKQEEVPRLLRRLARVITELGPMEIHDITFHSELTALGSSSPTMTVYYSLIKASPDPRKHSRGSKP